MIREWTHENIPDFSPRASFSSVSPCVHLPPPAVSPPLGFCFHWPWRAEGVFAFWQAEFWRLKLSAGGRSLSDSAGWPLVSSQALWRWDGTSSASLISLNHNAGTDPPTRILQKTPLLSPKKLKSGLCERSGGWEALRMGDTEKYVSGAFV